MNHPRGVAIRDGQLRVSSIYIWLQEDFTGSGGLMEHWGKYAKGALADALKSYSGGMEDHYDWRLNAPEPSLQS